MAEILDIGEHLSRPSSTEADSTQIDEFLLNEGLDLLVAYRSIPDSALRLRIKHLVEEVAAASARSAKSVDAV